MKKIIILLISFLIVKTLTSQCTAPTFTVDISAAADTSYMLSNQTRGGVCCVGSSTLAPSSNCVSFVVYIHPGTEFISFDVTSPAPSGSGYYQVNCGPPVSIGTPLCAIGLVSPFTITYCKPGGDKPNYIISAGTIVKASDDISIQKTGCIDTLFVSNVNTSSIVWTSIYPGVEGAYNSYLSCTAGCNSTIVNPGLNPPPYVDFQVSGMPNIPCGPFTRDTVRVYFVTVPTGTITPISPFICSASGGTVTFTANISGGAPPYKYDWSNVPGSNNNQTTIVTAAGTYSVTVKDKTKCPSITLVKTITDAPVATFSYSTFQFCKNVVNPYPIFSAFGQAGVFSASPAGLSFVSTSTGIINLAASASGTYVVTNTISPSGTCPGSSGTATITIYPFPVMTSASSASVCSGGVVNIPLSSSSGSSFSWYTTDNVNISGESTTTQTTTSIINTLTNSSTTNEVVIYTVTPTSLLAGSCVGTPQTVSVTIRPSDDATFNYASSTNCQTGANPTATITGLAGGVFSSGAGLVFLNSVGTIDLASSTMGSYTVAYTTNGLCPSTSTFPINITNAPLAGFSYTASPYCQSAANPFPTFSVTASGGTFSSTAGLIFSNNLTGEIDLATSTPGTYTVTNTIAPSGICGASSATAAVTITKLKVAGFSYTASPICQTSADPLPTFVLSGEAGTFSSSAGLSINSSTGLVNLTASTPATYTVTNTIAAIGGCPIVTETAIITITGLPIATFNYSATPFCSNSGNQLPVFTGGGVAGYFNASSVYLNVNFSTGLLNISSSLPGNYTIYNTIAAANGCPAVVENTSITITQLPDASIAYFGPYCSNSANPTPTLNVNGMNGVYTFAPSGLTIDSNAGNVDLSLSTAGTYTITNTVAAANGCPTVIGTAPLVITNLPVATFNYTSTPYCINGSNPLPTYTGGGAAGTFSATAGTAITSTNGLINLSGSSAGTHTVTNIIAAENGCPAVVATNTMVINPLATASAAADATICASGSYNLAGVIGGAASTLSWTTSGSGSFSNATLSNSIYTPSASDISAGSVVLTIRTNDPAGPCSFVTDAMTLTINPKPIANAGPTNTLTCSNTTLSLSGSGGGTYAWSGTGITSGSNSATPVINAPGTYSLVVTSPLGCASNVSTVSISQNTLAPTVSSANTGSLNCTVLSVNASATTSTTPVSYNWSGTGITSATNISTITVNQGGTFNYTVTNTVNNCKTIGSQAVIQNTTAPVVTSANTGSLNCTVLSVNASATTSTTPVSYNWAGTGITSATNISTITVSQGGTFNYTVTNTFNNCKATGSQAVVQNTTAPIVASANTGSLNCTVLSVNASATTSTTPVSYNWTGTGITSATNISTITVNQGGTFNYTVTNTFNSCKATGSQAVIQNTTAPVVASANTGSLNCTVLSVNASATTSTTPVSYNWSGTGITSATNISTITVNQGGTFDYTVTNTFNNCIATGSQAVVQNTDVPIVASANTGSLNCTVLSVDASVTTTTTPVSYNWSGTGITSSANISTIAVNQGGTFNYTVTNTFNNCKATGSQDVIKNTDVPLVASANTGSLNCTVLSVDASVTSSTTPVSYNWAGTGITSATNFNTITVNEGGTFSYTVTSTFNNCNATGSLGIIQNTVAPLTTASSTGSITCTTNTIELNSSLAGMNYTWTAPSGCSILSGSSLQDAIGQGLGTYSLYVSDPVNDCTYSITTSAIQNTTAPAGVSAGNDQNFVCGLSSVTLSGTATPTNSSVSWLGGVCGSPDSFITTACGPGTYTLVVTHPITGCEVYSTVAVISSTDVPQATLNTITNSITCTNDSVSVGVTLNNSDPVSYSWSGPGIDGLSNTAVITTTASGTYSVVITNIETNCQVVYNAFVPINTTPVTVSITPASSITCSSPSITLNVSPVGSEYTYAWSGPGILSGGTSSNPVVDLGGDFNVTVTNTISGCSGTASVTVPSNTFVPVVSISAPSVTTTCSNPTSTLNITSTPSTDVIYSWTAPTTGALDNYTISNPVASGSGIFTVVVTNTVSGCTSSSVAQSTIEVIPDIGIPTTTLSAASVSITCANPNPSVTLTSNTGNVSYSWSPATGIVSGTENTASPSFSAAGTYSAIVTNTNSGCATSLTTNVVSVGLDNTIPVVNLTGAANDGTITCINTSITVSPTITPSANLTYSWTSSTGGGFSGGTNQSTVTFTAGGTYTLAITNTVTGCMTAQDASGIFTVYENTVAPTVFIASPSVTTTCANPTATLNIVSIPSTNVVYSWTAPTTGSLNNYTIYNPVASGSGIFTVVVTNTVSGCVSSSVSQSTINCIPDVGIPTATLSSTALSITCANPTPSLTVATNTGSMNYSWTPTTGIVSGTENSANPSFNLPGTYSLVVTNTVSGCATFINSNVVTTVLDNTIPVVSLTGSVNNGTINCSTSTVIATSSVTPNNDLSYTWTTATGISGPSSQASATFTAAGIYTLAVTNTITGCSSVLNASSIFTVFVDTIAPISNFKFVTGCSKDSVKFIDQSSVSAGNIVDWNWSFGDGNNSFLQNPANIYTQTNSYTVSLQVRAANGCQSASNGLVSLIPPVVSDFVPVGGDFLINQPIVFTNQSSGATNYSWNFGDGNTNSSINPSHVFNSLGSYTVMLVATNSIGCTDSMNVVLNIKPSGYAIPGGFTPNGDGVNDGFSVLGGPFSSYELRVFNAWGNEIFLANSQTEKWDGSFKDTQQPAGTYIYIFNGKITEGEELKLKGEVHIIR